MEILVAIWAIILLVIAIMLVTGHRKSSDILKEYRRSQIADRKLQVIEDRKLQMRPRDGKA
ncbi:MAG: hypothetical protein HYX74_03875 [Acidobacteria bacterium]|nr:hypothetical protein [Acidobacteriota bacterium]